MGKDSRLIKKFFRYFTIVLGCMIVAFLSWDRFDSLLISCIGANQTQIITSSPYEVLDSRLIFTAVIGVFPLIYCSVQYLNKLAFWNKGFFTVLIMLVFGVLALAFRLAVINKLVSVNAAISQNQSFQYEALHFWVYLLFGFLIGAVVSLLVFKKA